MTTSFAPTPVAASIPFTVITPLPDTAQEALNMPIFAVPEETAIAAEPITAANEVEQSLAVVEASPVRPVETPVPPLAATPSDQVVSSRRGGFTRGETSEVWGLRLDRMRMNDAVEAIEEMVSDRTPRYIITANLNYAMLLDKDASMQPVTDNAALVLADGQPLVWRSRIGAAGHLPERVAGSELIYRIAERASLRGWRIYFLGAEAGVAQRCADTLAKRYPGLQIAGVQSPPYRKLSEVEQQQQRQAIIDSRADILLVAFGQPKGERWIHEHHRELGVPVSIQVGASFDFVAGTAKRAPKICQQLGMEWCYRMFSAPGRLIPRYSSNACFMFLSLLRDWRDYVDARFGEQIAERAASL